MPETQRLLFSMLAEAVAQSFDGFGSCSARIANMPFASLCGRLLFWSDGDMACCQNEWPRFKLLRLAKPVVSFYVPHHSRSFRAAVGSGGCECARQGMCVHSRMHLSELSPHECAISVNDPPRTRTWNLRLRRSTPYPLGQRALAHSSKKTPLTISAQLPSWNKSKSNLDHIPSSQRRPPQGI
jgi:hypothetical protein